MKKEYKEVLVSSIDNEPENWKTRLVNETSELRDKVNKLQDFMRTKQFYNLSRVEKDLIYAQLKSMLDYLQILGKRLEFYNLELSFEEGE